MTGSIVDGEDVVQDTLAKAFYGLGTLDELPALRPWLFQVAHNAAIDFVRRHDHSLPQAAAGAAQRRHPQGPVGSLGRGDRPSRGAPSSGPSSRSAASIRSTSSSGEGPPTGSRPSATSATSPTS
ncbi:MAG: RNA polymerase sigma factor [Myxococcota bacterium]|nr:RNA polymerase sigma factor [Myxococcota bacterium]